MTVSTPKPLKREGIMKTLVTLTPENRYVEIWHVGEIQVKVKSEIPGGFEYDAVYLDKMKEETTI